MIYSTTQYLHTKAEKNNVEFYYQNYGCLLCCSANSSYWIIKIHFFYCVDMMNFAIFWLLK